MKRKLQWAGLLAGLLLCGPAVAQINENEAISRVKRMPAFRLDSALPKIALEDWLLKLLGPSVSLRWELNDCGEQTGDPGVDELRDMPACVGIEADLADSRKLDVLIAVGTNRKGLLPSPSLYSAHVQAGVKSKAARRLSEVENLLKNP